MEPFSGIEIKSDRTLVVRSSPDEETSQSRSSNTALSLFIQVGSTDGANNSSIASRRGANPCEWMYRVMLSMAARLAAMP